MGSGAVLGATIYSVLECFVKGEALDLAAVPKCPAAASAVPKGTPLVTKQHSEMNPIPLISAADG